MADITLWYSPGACSLAPHILLHESGLPFEAIEKSIATGELMRPEFERINPKKRVPALAVDGVFVTEVPAISATISHPAPSLHLMGKTPMEQVRVMEWMGWLSYELHGQGFGGIFRPRRFTNDPDMFDSVQQRCMQRVGECFDAIDARLPGPFAVGDGLTAVDPYLLVFYRWGNDIAFDMRTRYKTHTAHIEHLAKRSSVARTLAAEGL